MPLTILALACAASALRAHDDMVGTRYVASEGVDTGNCTDNDAPCRTVTYALIQTNFGDAIKIGAGLYDFSGFNMEELLFGKQGLRGGYSTGDRFHYQDPNTHPTRIAGVDPIYHKSLWAHGFIPVDASGQAVERVAEQAQARADCVNGAAGQFPCWNIDFLAQIPLTSFSSRPRSASSLWGFVDSDDNREYAVVGLNNGTAIVDVTDPTAPVEVTTVPGAISPWREVKIYQAAIAQNGRRPTYAYISTEGAGGGLQVLDLTQLPNSVTLVDTLQDFQTSHTLYISNVDYATNTPLPQQQPFLYVAGANVAGGGYRIYNLTNPVQPSLVTVNPGVPDGGTPYMHDSTSMLITDNRTTQCDAGHNPCEVLVDFNVERVELWDVTEKSSPVHLGGATYPNARYIHSGWPAPDNRYIIVHDELDEIQIPGLQTSIYTLDAGDLRTPVFVTSFTGAGTATDHNGYSTGDRHYVAHYRRGLVIFDIADPRQLTEKGYFDTYWVPSSNGAGTDGAWGVYPFLPSGTILLSDIENGLFLLKRNETSGTPPNNPSAPSARGGGGGVWDMHWVLMLAALSLLKDLLHRIFTLPRAGGLADAEHGRHGGR